MSQHQHDASATPLWHYFQSVINWVKATFPKYRKEMKGVDWGGLHRQFQGTAFDTDKLEKEVVAANGGRRRNQKIRHDPCTCWITASDISASVCSRPK